MRLYIIRHGQSETNLKNYWTGWLDVPLTDKGRADALRAGKIIEGISFDKIYTSDLSRAMVTCELAIPGAEYETTPLLREVGLGSLEGTPILKFTTEDKAIVSESGYAKFGGESLEEFCGRVNEFLEMLKGKEYGTVAAFCHGGWVRAVMDTVVGIKLPRDKIFCNNCATLVLDLTAEGVWKIHSYINLP